MLKNNDNAGLFSLFDWFPEDTIWTKEIKKRLYRYRLSGTLVTVQEANDHAADIILQHTLFNST